MKRRWIIAVLVVACATLGLAALRGRARQVVDGGAQRRYLLVSSEESGTVSTVDLEDMRVVTTIPVGKRPRGITLSPDGKSLYVALSGSVAKGPNGKPPPGMEDDDHAKDDKDADGIGLIDLATMKLIRTIVSGSDPEQVAVSADGRKLYVANEDSAELSIIDVAENHIEAAVRIGKEPEGVTVTPDGKSVWVACESDNRVYVVDVGSKTVAGVIEVGARPRAIAIRRDNTRAVVTLENEGAVALVDVAARRVVKVVKLSGDKERPMGVALSPDDRTAYVTTGRGKRVVSIDVETGETSWSVEVGERPWGIAISPDGSELYTANGVSNDVARVDTRTHAVTARLHVAGRPWGVAVLSGR